MPAMPFEHGPESIAPEGAPTEHATQLCRSGPCPRCPSSTNRKASRPRALLHSTAPRFVGAGHARDALRARTGKHRARGRSYTAQRPALWERAMPAMLFDHRPESIAPEGAPTEHSAPLCRSGPCPRCPSSTDRKASRPRALLQSTPPSFVGAGHARDALREHGPESIAPEGAPTGLETRLGGGRTPYICIPPQTCATSQSDPGDASRHLLTRRVISPRGRQAIDARPPNRRSRNL